MIVPGPGPGPSPGPRHVRDAHPACAAGDARGVGLDPHLQRSGVQVSPAAAPDALVVARGAGQAARAAQRGTLAHPHVRDDPHRVRVEFDMLDHRIHQPQQPAPYTGGTHAVSRSIRFVFRQPKTLDPIRRAPT